MADNWQVTGQRETTTLIDGVFTPAMQVMFKTHSGVAGSVLIPMSKYSAANAKAAIDQRVSDIEDVNAL